MKLLDKYGKRKEYNQVSYAFYLKKDQELFKNDHVVPHFINYNDCAVLLGHFFESTVLPDEEYLKSRIEIYLNNIKEAIEQKSLNASHEVYTSSFEYLNKLLSIDLKQYEDFRVYYENILENQRIERQKKYEASLAKELQDEIDRIKLIKENIVNNVAVSGRDLLDVVNDLKINVAIRTKGYILKCNEISYNRASVPKGSAKSTINNLMKSYKIVLETLKEEIEWNNTSQEDKDEIERLFNGK